MPDSKPVKDVLPEEAQQPETKVEAPEEEYDPWADMTEEEKELNRAMLESMNMK